MDPLNPVLTTSDHKSTPSFYGGLFLNYMPTSKLNINLNGYYFDAHQMYHPQDPDPTFQSLGSKENQISSKLLLNTKLSYQVFDELKAYIGGRNLLNSNSREYYGADRTRSSYYIGLSYNL